MAMKLIALCPIESFDFGRWINKGTSISTIQAARGIRMTATVPKKESGTKPDKGDNWNIPKRQLRYAMIAG